MKENLNSIIRIEMTITDLNKNEIDEYYFRYINKLDANLNLLSGFNRGKKNVIEFFKSIPSEKLLHKYKPDKWSIFEVFQHLIDTERIFIYRCFRIARNDMTSLSGFDQNIYIKPSGADKKSLEELLGEFYMTRKSSIALLGSLTMNDMKNIGIANGGPMSARAAAFTIIGHEVWHMEIIKERYL